MDYVPVLSHSLRLKVECPVLMIKLFFQFLFDLLFCIILWEILDTIVYFIKIKRYKSCYESSREYETILYKLIFRLPQLLAERYADYVSDEFQEHGLYLFCGEQGSGKTYSMTYNINKLILKNPGVLF